MKRIFTTLFQKCSFACHSVFIRLFLVVSCFGLNAQTNLDSLYSVWLDDTQTDSVRILAFDEYIFDRYMESNPDSAILMADAMINFGMEKKYDEAKSLGYEIIGYGHYQKSDFTLALVNFKIALELAENAGLEKFKSGLINTIGVLYGTLGNRTRELEYYQRSLRISEEMNKKEHIEIAVSNIGEIYFALENYTRALEYFERGLQLEKEMGDSLGYAMSLNLIADVFRKQQDFERALAYSQHALKINEEFNDNQGIVESYFSIGDTYKEQGEFELALQYFNKGLETNEGYGASERNVESLFKVGSIYREQNDFQRALGYCRLSLGLARELGMMRHQRDACECLYLTYRSHNRGDSALQYLEKVLELEKGLNMQEANNRLQQMEIEKQALQDSIETAEKERLVLAAHEEEVRKKNQTRNVLIGSSLLIMGFAGAIYSRLRFVRKSRAEIQAQKVLKDKFFAIISHDLRGPVSSFLGLSDIVGMYIQKKRYTELKEMIPEINQAAFQLFRLLDNLLNWASQELSQIPYNPQKINVHEMVSDLFLILQSTANSKGISLENSVPKETFIWSDLNTTVTIFRNLVHNALKFTNSDGVIEIATLKTGNLVNIQVRDTGVGMSEDKLKDLFTLTDHSSTYGTKGEKGVGLGLQLVSEFTKLNKGELQVDSTEGKGTIFSVLLPASQV